jgi:surface polysaccharide O-acyltransferase-like enzyme
MLHASVESFETLQLTNAQYLLCWGASTFYDAISLPCVPLFVMLSGALLLHPTKVNEPIRVFLKKRLSRIGLAFVFWGAVYFAWSYYVNHTALSVDSIIQGFFSAGPYIHFWFIYLIAGLYLITPILRIVVAYAHPKILRYLILLWFVSVAAVPLFELITGFTINRELFLIWGWIGYFVLGAYLQEVQVKVSSKVLGVFLVLGVGLTIFGAWLMAFPFHYMDRYFFFFDSLTINIIIASVALYMILRKFPPAWPGKNHPTLGRVVRAISENTLPIYLFHLIILESFEKGFFGFTLSFTGMNPIIEVPLATFATLFVTLGLVLLMKKVPVLKKLVG